MLSNIKEYSKIVGIGTATPAQKYTQEYLLNFFKFNSPIVRKLMLSKHIQQRRLYIDENELKNLGKEKPNQLHERFLKGAQEVGGLAIQNTLSSAKITFKDIDYIICVSTSGFMVPGLSALYCRIYPFNDCVKRLDIVGMGCNAGLNALNVATSWANCNPGKKVLLVCCEINSAIYCHNDTVENGIVNSIFGDGAAALIIELSKNIKSSYSNTLPYILSYESKIITEQWRSMTFNWDIDQYKWSFRISKNIPDILGKYAAIPVNRLLQAAGLNSSAIKHWVIHPGGGKVIDSIKSGLQLTEHDVRHMRTILKEYGNLSSGSFLFILKLLVDENVIKNGDYGLFMTMGPGAQIECALVYWP